MIEFYLYYIASFDIISNIDFLTVYSNNCKLIFPEIFLVTAILILIIYGSLLSALSKFNFPLINKTMSYLVLLILFFLIILLFNSYFFYFKNPYSYNCGFNNTLIFDDIAFTFKIVTLVFSGLCILIMQDYVLKYKLNAFEYFILLLLSVLGMLLLCSAFDLMTIYLAIELQSLSFYVLAAFKRDSSYSTEAGLKYFILGSFSSGFLLLGSSFIYGFLGTSNLSDINNLLSYSGQQVFYPLFYQINHLYEIGFLFKKILPESVNLLSNNLNYLDHFNNISDINIITQNSTINLSHSFVADIFQDYDLKFILNEHLLIIIAMFFIMSALFFKIAAAPYHMWSPDVYEGSPTSSTLFFSIVPKLVLFVLFFRVFYSGFGDFFQYLKNLTAMVACLSIVIGSLAALKQRKIKRLLAYSSISHVGYLLIGVCLLTSDGVKSVFFYLIIYMLTSIGVWSIVLINEPVKSSLHSIRNLSDLTGLIKANPTLTISFVLILFSLSGIPPLAGFYAKLLIFLNAIKSNYYLLALIGVLTSTVSAYYYLRIIKIMCFDKKVTSNILFMHSIDYQKSLILGISVFCLIFLFFEPNFLNLICYKISFLLKTL